MRGHAGTLSSEPAYGFRLLSYRVISLHSRRERYTLRTHCLCPYLMTKCRSHSPMDRRPRGPLLGTRIPQTHRSPPAQAHPPHPEWPSPHSLTRGLGCMLSTYCGAYSHLCHGQGTQEPPALGPITMLKWGLSQVSVARSLLRRVPGEERQVLSAPHCGLRPPCPAAGGLHSSA